MREHGRNLERADDAAARDLRRLLRRDVAAVVQNAPAAGGQEPGKQVEYRGLAGAVGSDQRVDGSPFNFKVHVADSGKTLELLAQPLRLENDVAGHRLSWGPERSPPG